MAEAAKRRMNGLQKAAVLLVLLGDDAASSVYRNLPQEELHHLTQEIAELDYISPEVAAQVLEEYHRLTITQEYLAQGGDDYANSLLVKAFGEDTAKTLLDQVTRAQKASAGKLDTLQKADPQQLAKFLEGEHPQTIALVLAHLGVKSASSVMMLLPDKLRAQAVQRLAEMRQFSPEMVQKVAIMLHTKLQALGEQSRRTYAGVEGVAELLNRLDAAFSKEILEVIEQDDPNLVVSIRNLMFTFEDLLGVPESSIREFLSQLDKKTMGIALKGASAELKNHIFKAMSSRAAQMLKEDMEVLGPIRARDASQAQQEAVDLARKLEAQGKMTLKSGDDDEYIV